MFRQGYRKASVEAGEQLGALAVVQVRDAHGMEKFDGNERNEILDIM